MAATKQCRACGAEIPGNAPFGHCLTCLLKLGFGLIPDDVDTAAATDSSRRFGDYELIEQLGRGGMGVIYKARQLRLNRLVALKMISAGEFASPMLIHRFHREAEAAANLHHPNIVPIYEIGELRGQHFYSMQLVDGTGLDRHIGRTGFNRGEAETEDARPALRARQEKIARIVAKVARAVECAHQHGVLHRDLKPSNIILDEQDEPHLTDFGVAKVMGHEASNLTASGAIMGTPSYMAPEQAAGDSKRITTAGDIYSLGAILYTMLTGSPPFRAETPVETLRQVVEQEPKHPSTIREGIDSNLATIAMKCLEKEPARRYPSAALLAEDLERWLKGDPIQARPVATSERFWRWCRRNPKPAILASSLILILLAITIGSTLIAVHIKNLNDSLHTSNDELNQGMLNGLEMLYTNANVSSYLITANLRHSLRGKPQTQSPGTPLELTFVDYVYADPRKVLDIFAPILQKLEEDLDAALKRPVLIHLVMLKSYDLGYDAVLNNKLAFGRVGPASFVQLLDRGTGVREVATQDHKNDLTMGVFTRTNSSVAKMLSLNPSARLDQLLVNRCVAFGNSNSTTGGFVARWFMAMNGVFAKRLACYQHLKNPNQVIDEVRKGSFDVGFVNVEILRDAPDLKVIATQTVSAELGRCIIAGPDMEDRLFTAIRASLMAMRDPAIIRNIESEIVGFKVVGNEQLDPLREFIRGASAFDNPPNTP